MRLEMSRKVVESCNRALIVDGTCIRAYLLKGKSSCLFLLACAMISLNFWSASWVFYFVFGIERSGETGNFLTVVVRKGSLALTT